MSKIILQHILGAQSGQYLNRLAPWQEYAARIAGEEKIAQRSDCCLPASYQIDYGTIALTKAPQAGNAFLNATFHRK